MDRPHNKTQIEVVLPANKNINQVIGSDATCKDSDLPRSFNIDNKDVSPYSLEQQLLCSESLDITLAEFEQIQRNIQQELTSPVDQIPQITVTSCEPNKMNSIDSIQDTNLARMNTPIAKQLATLLEHKS